MKVNGRDITSVNEDVLVLPRGNQDDVVFEGRAVKSYDEFNKLVSVPLPPALLTAKGRVEDVEDTSYKDQLDAYNAKKMAWLVIRTLYTTTWDQVDADKPNTWIKWVDEFVESGMTSIEQQKVVNFVLAVNSLDQSKMDEAKQAFLLGRKQE